MKPIHFGWRIAVIAMLIAIGAGSARAQSTITNEQTEFWKQAKKQSLAYIDKMPEEALSFKPTPEIRSFSEQMIHLAYWNFGIVGPVLGKANPYDNQEKSLMTEIKTKAALAKFVGESYDFAIAGLGTLNDAKMTEKISIFGQNSTRISALGIALDHQAHHRGQTVIYLRLKGVTPPEG
jgi:uncharacterized damage-inducible protein DinB